MFKTTELTQKSGSFVIPYNFKNNHFISPFIDKPVSDITLDDVNNAASYYFRYDGFMSLMVTRSGFLGSYEGYAWEESAVEEVKNCIRWIDKFTVKVKRANFKIGSSYGLKHIVEHDCGDYISNGSFIVAALMRGYSIKPCDTGLNCYFNMKYKPGAKP